MVDRSVVPAFTAPDYFTLPHPEIISISNGGNFYALRVGDQPVVKLEFIFRAGLRFEAQPGEAFFAAKMLTEGTRNFNSKSISETLDQYGAFVEVHPGFDYSNLSIHIPTDNLGKIKEVISGILFEPSFPEDELELLKQIQAQQIKVNQQKNSFVASRLFRAKMFPENPYGHIIDEGSAKLIDRQAVVNFYYQWINGKFDIFLTGQFEEDAKASIIDLANNHMEKTHDFNLLKKSEECVFHAYEEKEESLQSAIFMGSKTINRSHPNYPGLLLLNEVFGGYFGSRLMQNIREEKGFTYGIHSHLASLKDDAYFVISTDVKKEFKDQTLSEIAKEIARIKKDPIGAKELSMAKNHLKGSILNSLTNPFAITEKLKNIYFYGLRYDFYENLFSEIDRIQSDELQELASKILFDKSLSTVIVG